MPVYPINTALFKMAFAATSSFTGAAVQAKAVKAAASRSQLAVKADLYPGTPRSWCARATPGGAPEGQPRHPGTPARRTHAPPPPCHSRNRPPPIVSCHWREDRATRRTGSPVAA